MFRPHLLLVGARYSAILAPSIIPIEVALAARGAGFRPSTFMAIVAALSPFASIYRFFAY